MFLLFACRPFLQACVPTHFLLGRQLHTPMFPVTSAGLSGGWSAWGALYGALHSVGSRTKRRNRFSSVRCGMNAEELQEIFWGETFETFKRGKRKERDTVGGWVGC